MLRTANFQAEPVHEVSEEEAGPTTLADILEAARAALPAITGASFP